MGDALTREQFIAGYMSRSGIENYQVDGEKVHWGGSVTYALPCKCGEEACDGWAMVTSRWWHMFQNGLTDLSMEEMMRRDIEERQAPTDRAG